MTRTERSFNPRAVIRDRSESKSGLDKSDRKGGAGAHNWGSYADEQDHEFRAVFEDYEEAEYDDDDDEGGAAAATAATTATTTTTSRMLDSVIVDGTLALASSDDVDVAAKMAVRDASSLTERRASALSEQERLQAREFRAKALKDGSDLITIARTSAAVSTSPPRKTSTITIIPDAQTNITV